MPVSQKNYITPAGYQRLQAEFNKLRYEERPEIVEVIAWAAGNGDRSENGDYIYGKKRLREIDRRLRFLTSRMDIAEIVDPAQVKAEDIRFGATVTVLNEEDKEITYRIVGHDESDPDCGKISWLSPIGQALFKKQVGDFVEFKSPRGLRELEVLEVKYETIG